MYGDRRYQNRPRSCPYSLVKPTNDISKVALFFSAEGAPAGTLPPVPPSAPRVAGLVRVSWDGGYALSAVPLERGVSTLPR